MKSARVREAIKSAGSTRSPNPYTHWNNDFNSTGLSAEVRTRIESVTLTVCFASSNIETNGWWRCVGSGTGDRCCRSSIVGSRVTSTGEQLVPPIILLTTSRADGGFPATVFAGTIGRFDWSDQSVASTPRVSSDLHGYVDKLWITVEKLRSTTSGSQCFGCAGSSSVDWRGL